MGEKNSYLLKPTKKKTILYKKKNSKKIEKSLLKCKKKIVFVTFFLGPRIFFSKCKSAVIPKAVALFIFAIFHLIAFISTTSYEKHQKVHKNYKTMTNKLNISFLLLVI